MLHEVTVPLKVDPLALPQALDTIVQVDVGRDPRHLDRRLGDLKCAEPLHVYVIETRRKRLESLQDAVPIFVAILAAIFAAAVL